MTPDQGDPLSESAELSVVVVRSRDAEHATRGGADRLLLSGEPRGDFTAPEPGTVSAVVRETDLPVWVALRSATDDVVRTVELGRTFLELGASGVAFGVLDHDLEVDRQACAAMCADLGGASWIFHGFDQALEADRSWRDVVDLPGLEAVVTAGSTRGLEHGAEDLISRAAGDPRVSALTLAAGGLSPDVVPWLVRAGVRRFAIGSSARADGSWTRASVSVDRVRSWRMLLDDALSRALGIPVD